jgi:hypothetical protein
MALSARARLCYTSTMTAVIVIVMIALALAVTTLAARRMGYSGMGGDTIVRCRAGHLFTTLWVPGASLKSIRLGMTRFQYCPVGKHWTLVTPVRDSDLTDEERQFASQHHDARVP